MAARGVRRPLPMALVAGRRHGPRPRVPRRRRPHRRLALSNLEAAFPARPAAERAAIARDMFAHFGRLLDRAAEVQHDAPRRRCCARVEFEGDERVSAAHALGKGVLLFTGHFGYWEMNALVHALVLHPMSRAGAAARQSAAARPARARARRAPATRVIYRRGAVRRVLRALGANQAIAVLIDQHIQTADAVYVDFFNRPGGDDVGARGAGAAHRRAGDSRCSRCRCRAAGSAWSTSTPSIRRAADDPDALRDFTQRCTDVLEMYVRRYPGLWLWMHRRWRDVEPAADEARGMFPRRDRREE